MIKAECKNKVNVEIIGKETELLAELTAIINGLLENGINEKLINIAVGLAKAEKEGTSNEFMKKTLKEDILNGIKDKIKNITEEQEEETTEEDDGKEKEDIFEAIKKMIKEAIEDED